jgi:hypothetical protein
MAMRVPISPVAAAQIVARNAVPVFGVVFLGWSAQNVLILYFLDTMLSIAVIFAGLMSVFARLEWTGAGRINGEVSAVALALALAAFFAVPLGVPLAMVLAASNFSWRDALADPNLRIGALMQAIAAFWSYVALWRALRVATPEDLRLKRRFALVFLRWVGVLIVIYTGIGIFLPLLVVAAYAALSIWSEIAPDRFLRAMPGGAEDADDAKPPAPTHARDRRRKGR